MTLKIGILSAAHMHIASYAQAIIAHPDAQLIGVADLDPERGRQAAAAFGTEYFPREMDLLASGLDGVIVTSENVYHRRYVEAAAIAGIRAILCEKPLATTAADARAMIAACAAQNVRLATAFPCRYSPAYRRLRERVQSGAIGDILAIRGANRGSRPGGWFTDQVLSGGGAVLDHTVHVADLNRQILRREATEVHAEVGNGFRQETCDDTGFLTISYDGGVFATLDTSWSRPKTYPTWGDMTLQVVGTGGVLDLDMFAQSLAHYDDRTRSVHWPGWGSGINGALIADFLKLCAGEDAPETATGEDGLRALEVALAAYRSAADGVPVPVLRDHDS